MCRPSVTWVSIAALGLIACGGTTVPSRGITVSQALVAPAELVELESPATRQELFREAARASVLHSSRPVDGPVLFPVVQDGQVLAAPGLEPRVDLFLVADAGHPLQLTFDGGERWPEDRRDSLHGLSEREAAELVARSLLAHWGIRTDHPVRVERAPGAPYAAAYFDGSLRINPSFVYLAASAVGAVSPAGMQ